MENPRRILFVCLGNIVRSPLAENLFMHLARQAGLAERFEVDSAGTGSWHIGEQPDARMRHAAAQHGLTYSGRARRFDPADFKRFDLIIAMDGENRRDLLDMASSQAERDKVHLLREFDPQGGPTAEVSDPYYGGMEGFERVYQVIERSCRGLLRALEDGDV